LKIFLTGPKGIGKSTIVQKVLQNVPLRAKGIITEKHGDTVVARTIDGSAITTIGSKKQNVMIPLEEGFTILSSFLESLEFSNDEIFVVDEIGFLESNHTEYRESLNNALERCTHAICVLRLGIDNYVHPNHMSVLLNVNLHTRSRLADQIISVFK